MNLPPRDGSTVLSRVLSRTDDGREVYVTPAEDAGSVRVQVIATDPWSALLHRGAITQPEADAARAHAMVWEATMIAPPGRTGLEPAVSSVWCETADRLGDEQMEAWREWRRAQAAVPVRARGCVYNAVAWHVYPADLALFRVGLRALARFYRT